MSKHTTIGRAAPQAAGKGPKTRAILLREATKLRLKLLRAGYTPIPTVGKHPAIKGWQTVQVTESRIRQWEKTNPRATNTGIRTGDVVGVDIDCMDPALVKKLRELAFQIIGKTPCIRIGRAPKALLAYRNVFPMRKMTIKREGETSPLLEILGEGQQFIGFGIHPDTEQPYRWEGKSLLDISLDSLPATLPDILEEYYRAAAKLLGIEVAGSARPIGDDAKVREHVPLSPEEAADLRDALRHIPNDMDHDQWVSIGLAIKRELGEDGLEDWLEFSAKSPKDGVDRDSEDVWHTLKPRGEITAGTIQRLARKHGWDGGTAFLSYFDNHGPLPPSTKPPRKGTKPPQDGLELLSARDIPPEATDWLWLDFLARGELMLFAGDSGSGKSTIMTAISARITAGGKKPDGTGRFKPRKVVMWTGEDSLNKTLVPRFIAAGGNLDNMHFVGRKGARAFDPAKDIPALVRAVEELGNVDLIILDPIVNAITGDSNKNAEVRRDLQPVVDMAHSTGACVVGITHFTKDADRSAKNRILGSVGFVALPRHTLATLKNHDREGFHWLARVKSNIGKEYGGLQYKLIATRIPAKPKPIKTSTVEWGRYEPDISVKEMEKIQREPVMTAEESAEHFLLESLPMSATQVEAEAKANGHSWASVRRAKVRLGVESVWSGKIGKGGGGEWTWRLPEGGGVGPTT